MIDVPSHRQVLLRDGDDLLRDVELVAGEEGVSPGQACVFYDAASGRARVLGGGFIQSAVAESRTTAGLVRPQRVAEPVRG